MQLTDRPSAVRRNRILALLAASGFGCAVLPAAAADQIFLRLAGVLGGSTDSQHKGEIEISSYSQSFRSGADFGAGSGAGAARAACGDITVLKNIDRSSPDLIMHVVSGRHISDGTITFRRTGELGAQEFYTVQLTDVIVDVIQQSDPAGEQSLLEKVSLKARQFRFAFRPQRHDGSLGRGISFGWDCVSNQSL